MRQEQNEAVERMEAGDMPDPTPDPQVRGMGGSTKSASGTKGLPNRSAQRSRIPAGSRRGSVTDLLSIFGAPGVGQVTVDAE